MTKYILKYEGKEMEVGEGEYLLGRSKDCDIKFMGESVSRKHAKLKIEKDRIYIEDMGSSNGTFVNGKLVRTITLVQPEDRIHLGKVIMIIKEKVEIEKEEFLNECPQCHSKIKEGMKFCINCGAKLITEEVVKKASAEDSTQDLPKELLQEAIKEPVAVPSVSLSPQEAEIKEAKLQSPSIPSKKIKEDISKEYVSKLKPFKTEVAGFWIRFLAYLIDSIILGVINSIIFAPFFIINIRRLSNPLELFSKPSILFIGSFFLFMLLSFAISLYYLMHGPAIKGGTPGKRLLHLKIYSTDGKTPIGWQKAFLRVIGYILSSLILLIGFLMIAFREDKKGLHDLLAKTIVLKEK